MSGMSTNPVRVLLVDDHPLLRDGIRMVLQTDARIAVVGEASGTDEALAAVPQCRPDLVITDIRMPRRSGIELVGALAEQHAHIRVLLLSMLDDAGLIQRALALGARGYVRKDASGAAVLQAIHAVAAGGCYLDAAVQTQLRVRQPGPRPPAPLTPRETVILQLIGQGHSSRDIADMLGLSVRTVETHRLRLRRKLHLAADTALAGYVQAFPEIIRPEPYAACATGATGPAAMACKAQWG